MIKQTIVRSDHYPIKLILNLNKLSSKRSSDKERETPKINNLSNLPIPTRKINIREAMSTMVMTENNIDAITLNFLTLAVRLLDMRKWSRVASYVINSDPLLMFLLKVCDAGL